MKYYESILIKVFTIESRNAKERREIIWAKRTLKNDLFSLNKKKKIIK